MTLVERVSAQDVLVIVDGVEVGSVWRRRKNEWRAGPWDPYVGHIKAYTVASLDEAVRRMLSRTGHDDLAGEESTS